MEKALSVLFISMLFLSVLGVTVPTTFGEPYWTKVRVVPELTELSHITGQEFTIQVEVYNVTNLYGFDIQLSWNTTYIEYVSHTVHIPVETYPDGILHEPVMKVKDKVDETASMPDSAPGTTYWLSYSSRYPADLFNGTGIAFEMTFRGASESDVTVFLRFTSTDLSDKKGRVIPHDSIDGTVIIHGPLGHDVTVRDVTTDAAFAAPGEAVGVTVVVQNWGGFTESFTVTAYANITVIGTETVQNLASKAYKKLSFTWDTLGAYGNYIIKAEASVVSGETDTADNTLKDGAVYVKFLGDIVGDTSGSPPDGDVDSFDFYIFSGAYGTKVGDPGYNPVADIVGDTPGSPPDGDVDSFDFYIFSGDYGKTVGP